MSNLTPELQTELDQEAKAEAKKLTGRVPIFRMGYEAGHYDGAEKCALKWQTAEASVQARGEIITQLNNRLTNLETVKDRYEKALKEILNQPAPLCHKTHIAWVNKVTRICNDALKPKQSINGTE